MPKLRSAVPSAAIFAASLASIVLVGCAPQAPLLNQPLAWIPTKTLDLGVTQSQGAPATVRFQTFTDTAANPTLVGENVEQATPRLVTTADPVGPFVTRHLRDLFARAGYLSGGVGAERVISGTVKKFFVRERNTYRASVELAVSVRNSTGKVLWQGTAWGANETFGRSYHLDNYQQVLSDALVNAADNLLKSPAVRAALAVNK